MKKIICVGMVLCLAMIVFAKSGDTKYVYVEKSALKTGTMFWSSKVTDVYYGDALIVIEENGKSTFVSLASNSSVKGWIPSASITSKKIVSFSDRVTASADELALAGKGFNAEIEAEYRKDGYHNYAEVDTVEQKTVSNEELYDFIVEGNLEGAE